MMLFTVKSLLLICSVDSRANVGGGGGGDAAAPPLLLAAFAGDDCTKSQSCAPWASRARSSHSWRSCAVEGAREGRVSVASVHARAE